MKFIKLGFLIFIGMLVGCSGGGGQSVTPAQQPPAMTPPVSNPPVNSPPQGPRPTALVAVSSDQQFEAFIKLGLSQWAGTADSSQAASLSSYEETLSTDASLPPAAFSDVNVQVDGVDEADISRFDGQHLYVADGNLVYILEADNQTPSTELINTLVLEDNTQVDGLHLVTSEQQSDLLAVIGSDYSYQWREDNKVPWAWRGGITLLSLYDIDNPADVTRLVTLRLQGYLIDTRRIGDVLYIVSRATPSIEKLITNSRTLEDRAGNQALIDATLLDDLLPKLVDETGFSRLLAAPTDCYLPDLQALDLHDPSLVTITAINLRDSADVKSTCMALNTSGIYVSREAMYLVEPEDTLTITVGADPIETRIHKFALTADGPVYRGSGRVVGSFNNSDPAYRMGEYQGRLAVVTSKTFNSGHRLTLLEEAAGFVLEEVGHLPDESQPAPIGKEGETIFATRILGNRAYIVTFLTTDPIYVVDLDQPRILGELSIPGFSSYLHPVNDSLILGIGKSVVLEEGRALFQGLKLQLFDVSNPGAPRSVAEISIGLRGTDSALSYDAHALAYIREFEAGTDRFALPIAVHGEGQIVEPGAPAGRFYDYSHTGLYLFEIEKSSASLLAKGALKREQSGCVIGRERGFLVDDAVHFLLGKRILSAKWALPDQISELDLGAANETCFFIE
jgi:uncharacterized secreted protein with C-terminal beta-propeller domain